MIENDKQLRITKQWLHNFKEALKQVSAHEDIDPILRQAEHDAIVSQIQEFEDQIAEYNNRKTRNYRWLLPISMFVFWLVMFYALPYFQGVVWKYYAPVHATIVVFLCYCFFRFGNDKK